MTSEPRRPLGYRFPRPDRRSLLFGLRLPQVAALAALAVVAVAVLGAAPSLAGVGLATALLAAGVPVLVAPFRDRTLDEWLPLLAHWARMRATRRQQWRSSLPLQGDMPDAEIAADPPPPLAGVELLRVRRAGRETGVVKDLRAGLYSVVLACQGLPFGLLDPAEQERRTRLWGETLATFAHEHSPVARLAWVQRSLPDDHDGLRAHLDDAAVLPAEHPARRSYADLIEGAAPGLRRHDTYLVLSVGPSAPGGRRAIRRAGGRVRGAVAVLLGEVDSLTERLAHAEIDVAAVVDTRRLAAVLRSALDPAATRTLARRERADPDAAGTAPRNAWPLATHTAWESYRSDSGLHATYWVAEWPRREVAAGFLEPLLVGGAGIRSVAVVMAPVPPSRAARGAEAAHAAHVADEELRAKAGYLQSARRRRDHEAILSREAELAEGHGEFRFSGYVTVTAADAAALEQAATEVEQAGFDASVELRRCYGEQDEAFTWTLPLGRGLAPRPPARRPAHRATTATIESLYPFVAAPGLGVPAPYLGLELYGGAFAFDPWALYQAGRITNPNLLVAGRVGAGKSAVVKSLLWRGVVFGRRAAVLDPKGEYGPLAAALGVEPIRLRPGGDIRLNPLDPGPGAADLGPAEVHRRRLMLLQAVAATALKRDLTPVERAACQCALDTVATGRGVPTLPQVANALLAPSTAAAARLATSAAELARTTHDLALEVRRLCDGDLRGMFDGPTTIDVDWDGPLVVLDFSQLTDDDSLAILMACATAWIQAAVARPRTGPRYLVFDEAWRLLSHLGTARWLRASLKLARQYGVANLLVMHRLSDLTAAGDAGSEQVALAQGLLADTETRILYAQAESELGATAELLGLSDAERDLLPTLPRGVALWRVGRTSHVVAHQIGAHERNIVDTDAGMATKPAGVSS